MLLLTSLLDELESLDAWAALASRTRQLGRSSVPSEGEAGDGSWRGACRAGRGGLGSWLAPVDCTVASTARGRAPKRFEIEPLDVN